MSRAARLLDGMQLTRRQRYPLSGAMLARCWRRPGAVRTQESVRDSMRLERW